MTGSELEQEGLLKSRWGVVLVILEVAPWFSVKQERFIITMAMLGKIGSDEQNHNDDEGLSVNRPVRKIYTLLTFSQRLFAYS